MPVSYLWCMASRIGKKIEAELRRQKYPITAFAEKINCTRSNVYNIFKRYSVNTQLLGRIAAALNVEPSFFYADSKQEPKEKIRKLEDEETVYETTTEQQQIESLKSQVEALTRQNESLVDSLQITLSLLDEERKKNSSPEQK